MSFRSTPRILLVDDEPHILDGLRRMLRSDFTVDTSADPEAALGRLAADGPYSVVVSDFLMPHLNGARFLAEARTISPDTSRILLTGHADLEGAAAAVNDGAILRFLLKPIGRQALTDALRAGVEQHRLIRSERQLLDDTLRGAVRALTEVLALASPLAFARSERLRSLVAALVRASGQQLSWDVELAAMLADLGAVAVPADVLQRSQRGLLLESAELDMIAAVPAIAEQILAGIPRIEQVRAAIGGQDARFDGRNSSDPRAGVDIPLGGRLLRLARDYDALEVAGTDPATALSLLRADRGSYDPLLLDALTVVITDRAAREPREVRVADLRPGMILASDLVTLAGLKLVAKGHELSPALMAKVRNYEAMETGVDEPVLVFIPVGARFSTQVPA